MTRAFPTIKIEQIDHDVPLPPIPRGETLDGVRVQWPFKHMHIGDSFLVKEEWNIPERKVRSAISKFRLKDRFLKKQFAVRTVEGGIRVWRID